MPRGRPRKSTTLKRTGSSRNIADHLEGNEHESVDIFQETEELEIQPRRRSTRIKKSRKSYFDDTVPETADIEDPSIDIESSQNEQNGGINKFQDFAPEAALIEDATILKDPTQNSERLIIETCNTTVEPMEEEFWAITPPRGESAESGENLSDATQSLPPTVPTADYSQFSPWEAPPQLSTMPETIDIRQLKRTVVSEDSLPPTIPKADYDRYSIMEMPEKSSDKEETQDITKPLESTVSQEMINSQFSALETPFQLSAIPETVDIRGKKPQGNPEASLPPTIPKADYDRYSIMEMPEKSSEVEHNSQTPQSLPATVPPLDYSQISRLETPYALSAIPIIEPKKAKIDNSANWSLKDGQQPKNSNKENPNSAVLEPNVYPETPETESFFEEKEAATDAKNGKSDVQNPMDEEKLAEKQAEMIHFRVSGKQNYDDFSMSTSVSLTIHCNNLRRVPLQERFPW